MSRWHLKWHNLKKGQGHVQDKIWWLHLRLSIQSICMFFVLWYKQIKYFTFKIQGQGHGLGQNEWSHLRPSIPSISLFFVSWQLAYYCDVYSKFNIWPWKSKVKVMIKVITDGQIWGLASNWYIWFSFCGNQTIIFWDIAHLQRCPKLPPKPPFQRGTFGQLIIGSQTWPSKF